MSPEEYMKIALIEAQSAASLDEVPIGACVVFEGQVISKSHNKTRMLNDPTAHAEILAIQEAAKVIGDWRLNEAKLFVTVEPCSMCAGAIKLARLSEIYFGTHEPNMGAVGTLYNLLEDPRTGSIPSIYSGILAEPCQELIRGFFIGRRTK